MKAKTKPCKHCGERFDPEDMYRPPAGLFCTVGHALAYARKKEEAKREKQRKADRKVQRKADTEKRKALMTRSQWYKRLERLVNQYVRWRDRDEPCCTCGTTNPAIKYDAGHFYTVAARSDIRFELTNIHKQCSRNCNQYGAGMRNEYEKFIARKYGAAHVDFLKIRQRPLHEVFPSWQDIEAEIIRYRALLRSHGVKPSV